MVWQLGVAADGVAADGVVLVQVHGSMVALKGDPTLQLPSQP